MANETPQAQSLLRRVAALGVSVAPLAIIGGLIYATFFVKAEVHVEHIQAPPIERRDAFFGIAVPQPNVYWAVGSYGKVVFSNDGGQHWAIQKTPVDQHLQAIAAWDTQRAVAVGNGGHVIVTDDGGANWREVEVPRSEVANKLVKVRTYANGQAWAVGELGAVLRSADYGNTWTRALPEKDQAWNDIYFVDRTGWLVGEFGHIQRSLDGGETWTAVNSPTKSSLMSVQFRDANEGVAVGLSGTLLVSHDGGLSWQDVPALTREHLNHVSWTGQQWLAVGDKGVRVSGDGNTWHSDRLAEQDLSWRTQAQASEGRVLLAGANLAVLDGQTLHIFGRAQ